jgi:hypothetical protein
MEKFYIVHVKGLAGAFRNTYDSVYITTDEPYPWLGIRNDSIRGCYGVYNTLDEAKRVIEMAFSQYEEDPKSKAAPIVACYFLKPDLLSGLAKETTILNENLLDME